MLAEPLRGGRNGAVRTAAAGPPLRSTRRRFGELGRAAEPLPCRSRYAATAITRPAPLPHRSRHALPTGYAGNIRALEVRLEHEYVCSNQAGLFVGDSPTGGSDGTDPLPPMVHKSCPAAFGLARGIAWINADIVGSTELPFLIGTPFGLKRFDLATTIPDFAVLALGSNSAAASTAAAIHANYAAINAAIRKLGIQRIYLATILPRGFTSGGTKETIHITLNTWIDTIPGGISGIINSDQPVHDLMNANTMQAEIASLTEPMRSDMGAQRMAARIHPRRSRALLVAGC